MDALAWLEHLMVVMLMVHLVDRLLDEALHWVSFRVELLVVAEWSIVFVISAFFSHRHLGDILCLGLLLVKFIVDAGLAWSQNVLELI